jgi:ribokinase
MAIYVVGSVNADVTLPVSRLPAPGSTILAGEPVRSGGGKGANVAVAAARDGGDVRLVAAVGDDREGERSADELRAEGVDLQGLAVLRGRPTGLAMICIDEDGENFVIVSPGANAALTPDHVTAGLEGCGAGDVCVVNFEIPEDAVRTAVRRVAERGGRILINASPVRALDDELLTPRSTLVVNAGELEELAGTRVVEGAAAVLQSRGCGAVVVTLGPDGVHAVDAGGAAVHVPPHAASPVDTTGAGDAFMGVFAAATARGAGLVEAVRRGAVAGALATERIGARAAMPDSGAIDRVAAA